MSAPTLLLVLSMAQSPDVSPDGRVTFRLEAAKAHEVTVQVEGRPSASLTRSKDGTWSATIGPLEPDVYGYLFRADGVPLLDPANPAVKPNLLGKESLLHVPGPPSLPWEVADVPHGRVHRHFYRSGIGGDERDIYVYTPPGYEEGQAEYPVLYLLHGYSDDPSAWTAVGRAHVILDNLIASGKAKPMLVAMPLGYGAPEMPAAGFGALDNPELRRRNMERFAGTLLREVMPRVEKDYRTVKAPEGRAVAGLSMGGGESLTVGLTNLDRFAWIGSFSAFGREDFADPMAGLDASANPKIRLLWIACGTEDGLIEGNRRFEAFLDARGVRHTKVETPGGHTWMVWRRNLIAFASLLFR